MLRGRFPNSQRQGFRRQKLSGEADAHKNVRGETFRFELISVLIVSACAPPLSAAFDLRVVFVKSLRSSIVCLFAILVHFRLAMKIEIKVCLCLVEVWLFGTLCRIFKKNFFGGDRVN